MWRDVSYSIVKFHSVSLSKLCRHVYHKWFNMVHQAGLVLATRRSYGVFTVIVMLIDKQTDRQTWFFLILFYWSASLTIRKCDDAVSQLSKAVTHKHGFMHETIPTRNPLQVSISLLHDLLCSLSFLFVIVMSVFLLQDCHSCSECPHRLQACNSSVSSLRLTDTLHWSQDVVFIYMSWRRRLFCCGIIWAGRFLISKMQRLI